MSAPNSVTSSPSLLPVGVLPVGAPTASPGTSVGRGVFSAFSSISASGAALAGAVAATAADVVMVPVRALSNRCRAAAAATPPADVAMADLPNRCRAAAAATLPASHRHLISALDASIQEQAKRFATAILERNGDKASQVLEEVTDDQRDQFVLALSKFTRTQDFQNEILLHHAASCGDPQAVRILLAADPDSASIQGFLGKTPLHHAAWGDNLEIVRILLKAYPGSLRIKDLADTVPLHNAARGGNLEIVRTLLAADRGSASFQDCYGNTPLHNAAKEEDGKPEIVRILLAANRAAASIRNNDGETPLHIAARGDNLEIVRILLAANRGSASIRNNDDRTPLHIAAWHSGPEIVRIFLTESPASASIIDNIHRTPLDWAVSRLALDHSLHLSFAAVKKDRIKKGTEIVRIMLSANPQCPRVGLDSISNNEIVNPIERSINTRRFACGLVAASDPNAPNSSLKKLVHNRLYEPRLMPSIWEFV